MTFWVLAVLIPLLTAIVLFWPMLRGKSSSLGLGIALLLLLPAATLLVYQSVGSPRSLQPPVAAADVPPDADMTTLVAELQARMDAEPDDVAGWMLLGRSYRSLQQFDASLAAFRRANELAPNDPGIMVEVAEAMIFAAGPGNMNPEVPFILEAALRLEPQLQKALWLSGMVAMQGGDDLEAIRQWDGLMPLLEPGSAVAASVQQQIDAARTRLGLATPQQPTAGWAGIELVVQAPENIPDLTPESALFIIARDPSAPNPPLGAVRLSPAFPARVRVTDANSMMPQRPISGADQVQLEARLSISGNPQAGEGDLQSEAIIVSSGTDALQELTLQLP